MTDTQPRTPIYNRRRFLRWAGAIGSVGVAGCGSNTTETPTTTATETQPATASILSAGEWWPMHLHDRSNNQYNRDTPGPTSPVDVAWTFETGGPVVSSPAVVDGSVYVGSGDGSLYALDMVTGAEQWRFETGGPVLSSPAVVNGTVYVGSNDQRLYALEAESGEKRWAFETGGAVRSSPTVAPTLQSSIRLLLAIGSDDGTVYLLDADTGKKRKKVITGGPVVSTPALFLGRGVVSYSFGSTDGIRYHGQAEKGFDRGFSREFGTTYSSVTMLLTERPLIELDDEGFFEIFGTDRGFLYKFAEFGEPGWRFDSGGKIRSSPALADGVVYVGSWDHHVYALGRYSGEQQWAFESGDKVGSSPAVTDGTLYIGSADQHVYALDIESGDPLWDFQTGGKVFSSPAVVRETVFVGSNDHSVYALTT